VLRGGSTTQEKCGHNSATQDASDRNWSERWVQSAVDEGSYAHEEQPQANSADRVLDDDDLSHGSQSTKSMTCRLLRWPAH
jgi:hypothetical protein